jgi:raffinose/stachyose/melibiose transport system substrate-binding protein
MTLTRRQLLLTGGAAGLAAVLPGCSRKSGAQTSQAASSTLDYWYYFSDADQQKYFTQHMVVDYPGPAKVKLTVKSNDTIDRLEQTALAAGKGPDLIVTPGPSQVSAYSDAGYLVDLTSHAADKGWDSLFAGWALAASKVDGKLVTLPTSYESMAFYVNPATLEKNGWTVPKNRSDFEAFCADAKGKGLVPLAAGNADWKGANEWHLGATLNHDAGPDAVHSALKGETPWTDPVFVDAVARLAGYFKQGWYGGSVDQYFTNQFPKLYKQLASGQAAAMISGTWEFASMKPYFGAAAKNDATWDWANLPSMRDGVPAVVWDLAIGQSTGVNAKSGNVEGAVDYLNFLTTDKQMLTGAIEAIDWQPSPITLTETDFSAKADPRTVRLYTELPKATTIGYTTWTFFPQKTETYMINSLEKVLTAQLTPVEFCAGIQKQFAAELAAGQVPAAPSPDGLS